MHEPDHSRLQSCTTSQFCGGNKAINFKAKEIGASDQTAAVMFADTGVN